VVTIYICVYWYWCVYALLYGGYIVTMLVCELLYICVYGGVVWCVWWCGMYGCAVPMCLCLCMVSYVCVLCHVLMVYASVLEWLGWSVLCCRWWLCPCLCFALVSMPSCLCAYLIVGILYY
jgi:hypothetical protein